MSKICLSEYFEICRPQRIDVCIIVRSVLNAVYDKKVICLDFEHVYYDTVKKKIFFSKGRGDCIPDEKTVCLYIKMLCDQCRYAGDDIYRFMNMLYEMVCQGEYLRCLEYLNNYIKETKRDRTMLYILCMAGVAVFEFLYLDMMNIRF